MVSDAQAVVLVVEDDELHRRTLQAMLRNAGYDARGASDFASALLYLEEPSDDIDVVLCDLRLNASTESGVDLLRHWKKQRPSTPFIFVTGVFDISQVVEAVKLGAEDYITKPYKPAELLHRVEECVQASREGVSSNFLSSSEESHSTLTLNADMPLEELERLAIKEALRRFDSNRTRAANALGISVRTLQRKLKCWSELSRSQRAPIPEEVT